MMTIYNTNNYKMHGTYVICGVNDYLAVKSNQDETATNEIGQLHNGDIVTILDREGTYWKAHSDAYDMTGYVNHYLLKAV